MLFRSYCLDYIPFKSPGVTGTPVYMAYSFKEGWHQITLNQLTNSRDCNTPPVLGG